MIVFTLGLSGIGAGQTSKGVPNLSDQALAFEAAGRYPEAQQAWQAVLALHPQDASAEAHLGLTQALQKHYTDAIPAYRHALALQPDLPGVNLNLGLALFKSERLAEAVEPLKKAAQETPSDPRPGLLLGLVLFGTGQYGAAITPLRQAVAQQPANLQLRLTLAQSCLWAAEYDCALAEFHAILQQDPNSAQADMIAGEALDAKGDTPGAIAQFRAAIAADPTLPNLHFGLGYLLWKQAAYPEAGLQFDQELKLEPNHAQALAYKGDVELKGGQRTLAQTYLQRSLAQPAPPRVAVLDLGILQAEDKRYTEAESSFRRAIRLEPDNPDAHWRLARLLQAMGNRAEAAVELATVQQLHQSKDKQLVHEMALPTPDRRPTVP